MEKLNVALISPNRAAYSETFIFEHKINLSLNANVKYLYQHSLPEMVENEGPIVTYNIINRGRRKISKFFFPGFLNFHERALLKYFKKHRIDVVVAEFGMTAAAIERVCTKAGIPLIAHFHGADAYIKDILFSHRNKYGKLFDRAAVVFVVSEHMRKQLTGLGCNSSKLVVNHYGPSDIFFDVTNNFTSQTFVSVGRFVEKKAPDLTIMAFAKAVAKYPDAKLKMVGDGPLQERCKMLVEKLCIQNNVEFIGVADRERIKLFFSEAIAFVQHSVVAQNGDSEGTPVALLEASASGLPVVATRHAGIPDVIIDGTTGFLVEEKDVDGMAEAMIRLLDEPGLASQMGAAGRMNIRENFTLEKHLNILNKAVAETVAKSTKSNA